jgi:mycofactocin precursor
MAELSAPTADVDEENGQAAVDQQPLIEDDLLVEDVSIDGMCGVY